MNEKCYLWPDCPCKTGACAAGLPDDGCPVYRYFKKLLQPKPVEPIRKKGRWFEYYTCTCGTSFPTGQKPKFCHECGKAIAWKEDTKTPG